MLSELFNIEKVFNFCEKICYFFFINMLFILSCLPVLLFFLFAGSGQIRDCLPLFLFCMLSVPPALSAVFFSMNRILHGVETGAVKDFVKGYKTDFSQKLRLGAGQMLLLFIFWTNIEFFAKQIPVLPAAITFVILFSFVIIISPCLYLLASRYEMRTMELVKMACIIVVTKPVNTLGSIAAAALILMAMEISAGTTVLFMAPVYGGLIVFLYRNVLRQLEAGIQRNDET